MPKDLTPPIPHEIMKYGAPMGRRTWNDNIEPFTGRLYLHHERLDSGGYDKGGAYWGTGQRLYSFGSEDDSVNGYIRADDREHALAKVRALHPSARFFG